MLLILIINYYSNFEPSQEKEIYETRAYNLFEEDKIFKEKNIDLFNQLTNITKGTHLNQIKINNTDKTGRNDICPLCDSGKKYKKCCGKNV